MKNHYIGVYGSASAWLIAKIQQTHPKLVVFCKDKGAAEHLEEDLRFFSSGTEVLNFPAWETLPFEEVSPDLEVSSLRIRILLHIASASSFIVITTPESLLQRVLPIEHYQALCFSLAVNQVVERDALIQKLSTAGLTQVPIVEQLGEFAVRGSVIDLYAQTPIRLRLTENVLEEIQSFDLGSQRSEAVLEKVDILPVREVIPIATPSAIPAIVAKFKDLGKKLEAPPREIARIINAVRHTSRIPGLELFEYLLFESCPTVLDILPKKTQMVIVDPQEIKHSVDALYLQIQDR